MQSPKLLFSSLFFFFLLSLVTGIDEATSKSGYSSPSSHGVVQPSSKAKGQFMLDGGQSYPRGLGYGYGFGFATCDKNPRICNHIASAGPDCCNRQCVNLSTNWFNCGKCGKRCSYFEICCDGRCVKPYTDTNNCGWCNNKCKHGSSCNYGMCNYA